jgi:serine/threonine protein kinase
VSGQDDSINRPVPNLQIPGYTVQAVAGRGGNGTVYRAEQASPKRLVALKLLTEKAASPASLAAFQREANTIARLEHPHILPVYGFGENNGRPYLVLRYLSGGSVADRLKKGPIDPRTALRWMRGVADALDFAHERGLVHRDVKPSNILLDQTGNPYLTDFGIAGGMLAAEGERPTGSAPYMSPEQGRGEPVDHRADIYSLAVSLFEMLTGRPPYEAETPLGLIVRHISDPIPSARALNPAISPAVDDLLQWGMAKQPGERPKTAGAFARLLDRALEQPDVPSGPPPRRRARTPPCWCLGRARPHPARPPPCSCPKPRHRPGAAPARSCSAPSCSSACAC